MFICRQAGSYTTRRRAVARTLRPGTTMVITDYAATPDTRTGPDFTVITEDPAVRGKRVPG
jgi:hypothetical protein